MQVRSFLEIKSSLFYGVQKWASFFSGVHTKIAPFTSRLHEVRASPALFVATHTYSPLSSGNTSSRARDARPPSRVCRKSGLSLRRRSPLNQATLGDGRPPTRHSKTTLSPSWTIWSLSGVSIEGAEGSSVSANQDG